MRCWKCLLLAPFLLLLTPVSAQVVEPATVVNDPAFASAARYSARTNHDALLVYRAGTLVYETYQDFDANTAHVLHSGTKSFSCAIAVRAQMDGLLTLDEPVSQTLSEWADDPARASITIRQLLTLTDGLPGYERGARAFRRGDAVQRSLELDMVGTPGEVFVYGASHFFLFSELMRRKLGSETAWDYLTRTILVPLDIVVTPGYDEAGNVDLGAGAQTTAREWARYGQLILQDGVWNGATLLDPALLRECFYGTAPNLLYGLTWWLMYDAQNPIDIDVNAPQPDRPDDGIAPGETLAEVYIAGGAFDQRLFILPEYDLVVVRLAGGSLRYSDAELMRQIVEGL
jgi:CubicO group peptidase (beta-lactamase class C family)